MTWFKVDDNLALHPKVLAAGNPAMGLWVRAGAWSAAQKTDGLIPKQIIPKLDGKPADTKALINAGLWTEETDGYRMHDWPDYQPTRAETGANKARGTLGAHRRWHQETTSPDCPHCIAGTIAKP